jgi:hypothetical protein
MIDYGVRLDSSGRERRYQMMIPRTRGFFAVFAAQNDTVIMKGN